MVTNTILRQTTERPKYNKNKEEEESVLCLHVRGSNFNEAKGLVSVP